ncbi:uncharacterized protein Fot_52313 [Forsythia ovata]|uniref:Uncharacterized protein n=1 Tax=Forsythia ovata TaxID=205694 RepID=A0ABD1PKC4_9LAMI
MSAFLPNEGKTQTICRRDALFSTWEFYGIPVSACKKHPVDLSSSVGVCASYLRESLFVLIAAQAQKQAEVQEGRWEFNTQLFSLAIPRSVSPYVSCRKFDTVSTWYLRYSSPR